MPSTTKRSRGASLRPSPIDQQATTQGIKGTMLQMRTAQPLPGRLPTHGFYLGEVALRGTGRIPNNLGPRVVHPSSGLKQGRSGGWLWEKLSKKGLVPLPRRYYKCSAFRGQPGILH